MSDKGNKLNFHFRYQPTRKSRLANLVEYYNQPEDGLEMPRKDMVLAPLEAYWMPYAAEWQGKSPEEVRRVAKLSIHQLQLHIQLLQQRFHLAESEIPQLPQANARNQAMFEERFPSETRSLPETKIQRDSTDEELDLDYNGDFSEEDSILDAMT